MTRVQVIDQHGGSVTAVKDQLMGFIYVEVFDARNGNEESFWLDPKDPQTEPWIKKVFPELQADILLN